MSAELVASHAAILAALALAVAKAIALAALASLEKTCHETVLRAEVLARRSLANKRCCHAKQ